MKNEIFIKGARSNNLKNIDVSIPRNQLVVVTGVSGSGKSSLTMDTLFAEGQRRYVESLSSYARQFLMRMKKPDVDYINGICPAIAIEQKVSNANARSTVGTLTELYDYLRLLYARIGKTISPVSGLEVKKHTVADVIEYLLSLKQETRIQLFSSTKILGKNDLEALRQRGFTRVKLNEEIIDIETAIETFEPKSQDPTVVLLLIDRLITDNSDHEFEKRAADSILTAFNESNGECLVQAEGYEDQIFNNRFEADGITFEEPSHQLFNYNNPYGACPKCEGYGKVIGIDEDRVIPDKSLSVLENCVACWRGETLGAWKTQFLQSAHHIDFPVHRAYYDLTPVQKNQLWKGTKHFQGIDAFFEDLESHAYKIQNRVLLSRYRGKTTCPECEGQRLRKAARYVKLGGKNIAELTAMPISELSLFFEKLELNEFEKQIGKRLLIEVESRLKFMQEVGLSYLQLDRLSGTLSGGETQRINLTRTLGSNLTSSLYILDEPSIGLHPRDTTRLVNVLRNLRDLGNTVVVVEHEEEIIANCDYLIDIGPAAGIHGGNVVFAGPYSDIYDRANDSLTAGYMSGRIKIPVPTHRRKAVQKLELTGCRQHNLKNIGITIPLQSLTVVTGVSGSGKTTLIKQILYPALQNLLEDGSKEVAGVHDELKGDIKSLKAVEMISQNPIGRSSRSNPVTYVKAYDAIRDLFTKQQLAKIHGFKPKHFSFNVEGGRCETCKGDGEIVVSMQFLADVRLTCEECNGMRFKTEVLDVTYKDKNISEVLDMSVEEALEFFKSEKDIIQKIKPLNDVGLGYIKLGQSSSTLSGGEAQRVKLAYFLGSESSSQHIFFIFDEPTTGLHFHDIKKLLDALQALVERGHTVLVIEHNLEVAKSADWIIDLGPEGGDEGGNLVFQGVPEDLVNMKGSYTAAFLKDKMEF